METIFNSKEITDMKAINTTYNNLLGNYENNQKNYKQYLKRLIEDNLQGVVFSRPLARNLSEQVCSSNICFKAINNDFNNASDDFTEIFQAAKLLRKEILENKAWKFEGSYQNVYLPKKLVTFLRWVIIGPKANLEKCTKKIEIEKSVNTISQIIINATKTNKQVQHKPLTGTFRQHNETPFSVGLGLHIHKTTRSKSLINLFADLHLSVSYNRVLNLEKNLAYNVIEVIDKNGGVHIQPNVDLNKKFPFALDNTDFQNDTPDGKNQFHGTTQVSFQKKERSN